MFILALESLSRHHPNLTKPKQDTAYFSRYVLVYQHIESTYNCNSNG
jgi:hypothetical protein